jgi:hypothetical protein
LLDLLAEYEQAMKDPPPALDCSDDPHQAMLLETRKRRIESQLRFENALLFVVLLGATVWVIIGLGIAWERLAG